MLPAWPQDYGALRAPIIKKAGSMLVFKISFLELERGHALGKISLTHTHTHARTVVGP